MLKAFNDDLFVCGVDEVGRGCLAGPVTAAAVILPKNYSVDTSFNPTLLKDTLQLIF